MLWSERKKGRSLEIRAWGSRHLRDLGALPDASSTTRLQPYLAAVDARLSSWDDTAMIEEPAVEDS